MNERHKHISFQPPFVHGFMIVSACITLFSLFFNPQIPMEQTKHYSILCLGDSYTIGQSVASPDRFPNQAVSVLKSKNILFNEPKIIATTGWTTDELANAIHTDNDKNFYDVVTLLIGVNNQYRGRDIAEYRSQFADLLQTAVQFANGKSHHVIVISIPDWGATPFADGQDRKKIAGEIDEFNWINKEETARADAQYIDITDLTREYNSTEYVADDGLHPSGKLYSLWVQRLAPVMENIVLGD